MSLFDDVDNQRFDAIVIGSGFGGSVAASRLAKAGKRVLVIERGTWWSNPEGPGLAPKPPAPQLPGQEKQQYWPRPNDARGLAYLLESIYKEIDPWWDLWNPRIHDNDLGPKQNRRGLYRVTRFSSEHGKVDVVSSSAVGGGSLIYSGVNLIPTRPVLDRIGLGHLTTDSFRSAGKWMKDFRGRINKLNTKVPVPGAIPKSPAPGDFQLSVVPESNDAPSTPSYEMANPSIQANEDDYLLLDRARVLKRSRARVLSNGGFKIDGADAPVEAGPFLPLPLSIVEYDPDAGSDSDRTHAFCLREGRCIGGCLPSARHTLYKSLQKLIQDQKLSIVILPETKVSHLSKSQGGSGYGVHVESYFDGSKPRRGVVRADKVFVAAGCLSTNEILLRTQRLHTKSGGAQGLALAPALGRGFSTNGDFFGFARGVGDPPEDAALPDTDRMGKPNPTVGPINSSGFHVVVDKPSASRIDIHVEDAGIPEMFARLMRELLPAIDEGDLDSVLELARAAARTLIGRPPFSDSARPNPKKSDQEEFLTERELIGDVFFFNVMGAGPHEPLGTFYLDDEDELQLRYEKEAPLADWRVFAAIEAVLEQLAEKMNGRFAVSPFWRHEKRVTVVHPLGGCGIGANRREGTVDSQGRVFDGASASETAIHAGLYVVDAAAIPGALAVNPTFTIVAQANHVLDSASAP